MEWLFKAIFGAILGRNSGGSGGSGVQQQQDQGGGLSPSLVADKQETPSPTKAARPNFSWLQSAGEMLGNTALTAFGNKMTAKSRGKATFDYNQAAFPGTNPWEQLGSGAQSGGQLADVAVQTKQMQNQKDIAGLGAASQFANTIVKNTGNAGIPMASQILRRAGMPMADTDFQDFSMLPDNVTAGISQARGAANLSQTNARLAQFVAITGRINSGVPVTRAIQSIAEIFDIKIPKLGNPISPAQASTINKAIAAAGIGGGPARTGSPRVMSQPPVQPQSPSKFIGPPAPP